MKSVIEITDKSQKIIDAAVSLFQRTHDVKKVSLEAIAHEAKVSPTTIYNNFSNRENLLCEVIKVLARENLDSNRKLVCSDIPFPQKITGIISGKLDLASKTNTEIIDKLISQDKTIAPFIDEIYKNEIRPLWLEIIADGKKQGYIDASLDEEALLTYLDALKAGFKAKQDVLRNFADKMELIEQLTRIMFYGFLKKDIDLFRKEGK
ncbi:MAG: helix-turn-helix domain containing protein [Dehalococcoidales bacterium]|nr:helix-turn-helix domain containing protein [Dehalococcoidales bacterium]